MIYFCKDTHKLSEIGRDVLDTVEDAVRALYDRLRNNDISMWEHALKVKNLVNDCNIITGAIEKADLRDDKYHYYHYSSKEVELLSKYEPSAKELFTVSSNHENGEI